MSSVRCVQVNAGPIPKLKKYNNKY